MTRQRWTHVASVLLPVLRVSGLLVPGDSRIAQEIRTFAGLITVLILLGYGLARLLRLLDRFDNWLDALSLSVALSWVGGLALWLPFFYLNVSLQVVSFVWLGATLLALIASTFLPLPHCLTARPSRPWFVIAVLLWVVAMAALTYLYGGGVISDNYSYTTWLRNIRVGDIQPGVNIHASWEEDYPFYKNLYAPTLLYYAICSFLARVDVNWIWTHAPVMWVPVMLAMYFSLACQMFKRKAAGYVTLFIVPLAGRGLFAPSLGNSHALCNSIFLPMAWWLYIRTLFAKRKALWWMFPLATLIAIGLTFEHIPHIIHFLFIIGTVTMLHLLSRRRDSFWRSAALIALVLLLIAPFVWHTWQLASAYGYEAEQVAVQSLDMGRMQRAERFLLLGSEHFFIVRPERLFSPLTALMAFLTVLHIGYLWRHESARIVIASLAIVVFIGFNPLLTPFLSRTIAPHVTFRLGEALIVLPVLAYGLTRAASQTRAIWRHRRRIAVLPAILLLVVAALVAQHQFERVTSAMNDKVKAIVYSPAGVSTNLSDRLMRRIIESELQSPPYPILDPPARLTRYLDAATLDYIRDKVPSNSVFLCERLAEYNLPAYADQLTYLGRLGWPGWGDVCPRVRREGARAAFPLLDKPNVVYHRLEVACDILDPDADADEVEALLIPNESDIDYVLVTPNTAYLGAKLDQVMPQARVYAGDGFAIYATSELDASR